MRMLPVVLVTAVATGCVLKADNGGVVDAAPGNDSVDLFPDAEPEPDAPLGAFSEPVRLIELGSAQSDDDPALTADMLEIVFASSRGGGGVDDLYVATRQSVSEPFDTPVLLANVNDLAASDEDPGLSADGLILVFSSNRVGSAGEDIYIATRPDRNSDFGTPTPLAEINGAANEDGAELFADGLGLVFESNRGGLDFELFVATRTSLGEAFGTPVLLSEVNAAGADDEGATISLDGRAIVFESNRAGTLGADDIWMAERSSASEPFGEVVHLVELSSARTDSDPWISDDKRTIVFQSARLDGNEELFISTR